MKTLMKRTKATKLQLGRDTLRQLNGTEIVAAIGGLPIDPSKAVCSISECAGQTCTNYCPDRTSASGC